MIECVSLSTRAGNFELRDVSFRIPSGAWGVVLGPAGAGKTTLLETIAGVRRTGRGSIALRGVPVTQLPAEERRVGIVYQHGFLFPHLRVAENVSYGASDPAYVQEIGRQFGIDALFGRSVMTLSGGERQIVALARALAPKPDVLLLDEPFASLDPRSRTRARSVLRKLVRERGVTVLQVTHDLAEARTAGDVAILMQGGRLTQVGTPDELLRHPASASAAEFVGAENVWVGKGQWRQAEGSGGRSSARFESSAGLALIGHGELRDGPVHAVVRGEDVVLSHERQHLSSEWNVVDGTVIEVAREGWTANVAVDVHGEVLVACVTMRELDELGIHEGDRIVASVKATAVHLC